MLLLLYPILRVLRVFEIFSQKFLDLLRIFLNFLGGQLLRFFFYFSEVFKIPWIFRIFAALVFFGFQRFSRISRIFNIVKVKYFQHFLNFQKFSKTIYYKKIYNFFFIIFCPSQTKVSYFGKYFWIQIRKEEGRSLFSASFFFRTVPKNSWKS